MQVILKFGLIHALVVRLEPQPLLLLLLAFFAVNSSKNHLVVDVDDNE